MSELNLTNNEITILEIIGQQPDIHRLSVLAQFKEMHSITGQKFSKEEFNASLTKLKDLGLVKQSVGDPDVYIMTLKGRDLLNL
ncbi:MAG: hypothetical protein ACTSPG_00835 [Candidatus Hodarchaeales archaeon]